MSRQVDWNGGKASVRADGFTFRTVKTLADG